MASLSDYQKKKNWCLQFGNLGNSKMFNFYLDMAAFSFWDWYPKFLRDCYWKTHNTMYVDLVKIFLALGFFSEFLVLVNKLAEIFVTWLVKK